MTNRLELNWKLDGFVDEQRYYCSETPIDPKNLPVPKAVLVGDVRTYTDTDIVKARKYYVAISSVKNGVEKLSNTSSRVASNSLILLSEFRNNFNEEVSNAEWTKGGNPIISSNKLILGGLDYLQKSSSDALQLLSDFTVRFKIKDTNPKTSGWSEILTKNTWGSTGARGWWIEMNHSTRQIYFGHGTGSADESITIDNFMLNTEYELSFEKIGNTIRVYKDGVLAATKTFSLTPSPTTSNIFVGALSRGPSNASNFVGELQWLEIFGEAVGSGLTTTPRI
jgi:hypothetical protein